MSIQLKFSRTEFAGSLGDLGTLLPLGVGLIVINRLEVTGVFFTIGLFYLFAAFYFRVTSPVEPMKVISGYAIATAIPAAQIQASCFWVFLILLVLGATGLIDLMTRYISKPVVRGVQLSTGILLIALGIRLMLGTSVVQLARGGSEPLLLFDNLAGVPIGIVIGGALGILCLYLLDNKRLPAAVVVVGSGLLIGVLLGKPFDWSGMDLGFHLPQVLPYGLPSVADFSFALIMLTLPQIPMTVGNAIIANADLSRQYFQQDSALVTHRRLCLSMSLANLVSFFLAGFPVCHGAGGLASRYRFGARTGGSNLIIGAMFLLTAILFGTGTVAIVQLIPLSVLGVLLVFAGGQLGLSIIDLLNRKDLFVILMIVGITLASNLAAGFIAGVVIDRIVRWETLSI